MPGLAGHVLGVLVGLDLQPLVVAVAHGLQRMDVQAAEPAAETFVVLGGQVLVAEHHHVVLQQGAADLGELVVGQVGREVDALDLRADHRRQRAHVNRLVGLAGGFDQFLDGFTALPVHELAPFDHRGRGFLRGPHDAEPRRDARDRVEFLGHELAVSGHEGDPVTEMGRSAGLTGFADLARTLGLDPYRLAAAEQVPVSTLASPDLKIPAANVGRLLERAARTAGLDDFGLRLAEKRRLSNMGPVGLIAREQPTLRKALEVMVQYQWMQSEALSLTIDEADDIAVLHLRIRGLGARLARQATELCIGVLCTNIRAIVGGTWRPQAVLFRHGPPASDATHRRVFGLTPQFNQDLDGLALLNAQLDAPTTASDPAMAREVERYIDLLAHGHRRSVADRVEELIVLLLPTGGCTAQRVSRHLGVDRRTLHRWLAEEGLSFSGLLDEKRRELVLFHLGDARRSLAAISDLAGFASPSSFSHWSRRVLGRSPRSFRPRQVAGYESATLGG